MKVGVSIARGSKATTLLLCVALLASFWNGACALACTLAPMTANAASIHDNMASHAQAEASGMSGMIMEGHHDCCPHASARTQVTALQPPVCPGPQAVAWMTVEDTPVLAGTLSPAIQPQPDFFGTIAGRSILGITDRRWSDHRWPPGSARTSWLSPTGFTPTITQILV